MEKTKNINSIIPDNELIKRIIGGEKQLFEIIMRRYNPRLFRVGRSIIRDDDEVEDILQDTYIKIYENLDKFEGRADFATWAIRILMNTAFARKAKQRRFAYDGNNIDENNNNFNLTGQKEMKTPEKNIINEELKKHLEEAVDKLPQIYRTVFMMREVENMSVKETSECLQISESNVKVRLNRAKEYLKMNISQVYNKEEIFQFMGERCDRVVAKVMNRLGLAESSVNK